MAKKKRHKFGVVSERALVQRITRKLAGGQCRLKCNRSTVEQGAIGRYYLFNVQRNFVIRHDVDLAQLGRELGALAAGERLKASR